MLRDYILGVYFDRTAQKRQEGALKASNQCDWIKTELMIGLYLYISEANMLMVLNCLGQEGLTGLLYH